MRRTEQVFRAPVLAQAEIVAADLGVEIVVERAQMAVLELHANQAGAAGHRRRHLLDDLSLAPLAVVAMGDDVSQTEIETKSVGAHVFLLCSTLAEQAEPQGARTR